MTAFKPWVSRAAQIWNGEIHPYATSELVSGNSRNGQEGPFQLQSLSDREAPIPVFVRSRLSHKVRSSGRSLQRTGSDPEDFDQRTTRVPFSSPCACRYEAYHLFRVERSSRAARRIVAARRNRRRSRGASLETRKLLGVKHVGLLRKEFFKRGRYCDGF